MSKYLVKAQVKVHDVLTTKIFKLVAFNLIHLEQKIRKEIKELQARQNKNYYLTGGYTYQEYSKRDYLIDIIEDVLKEPEEINSMYLADEILELFYPNDELNCPECGEGTDYIKSDEKFDTYKCKVCGQIFPI